MGENQLQGLMDTTLDKIRSLADSGICIGERIDMGDGVTILPVSKVSYGFTTGGSDWPSKAGAKQFGGGAGGGVSITPIAFMVFNNGQVKLLQINGDGGVIDKAITMVPELIDKISAMIKEKKANKEKEECTLDETPEK